MIIHIGESKNHLKIFKINKINYQGTWIILSVTVQITSNIQLNNRTKNFLFVVVTKKYEVHIPRRIMEEIHKEKNPQKYLNNLDYIMYT